MRCKLCNKHYTVTIYKSQSGLAICPHCGYDGSRINKMGEGSSRKTRLQAEQGKQHTSKEKEGNNREGMGRLAGV